VARKFLLIITVAATVLLSFSIWGCLPEREAGEQQVAVAPMGPMANADHVASFFRSPPVIVDRADTVLALNVPAEDRNREGGMGFTANVPYSGARRYPYGTLASALIGFRGKHGQGLLGIEYLCDTFAAGADRDLARSVISRHNRLVLTISKDVQVWAEADLARQMKRLGAARGALILMDVKTGEILAMASRPGWDPENAWSMPGQTFVNHAISDELDAWVFFPMLEQLKQYAEMTQESSVKDVACVSTGHQGTNGKKAVEKVIPAGRGGRKKWGWSVVAPDFVLWSPWNQEAMQEFTFPASSVRDLWKLGLGQESGLCLAGEKHGSLPTMPPSSWEDMAYNSVKATPIQMLRAFAAIINSGYVPRISIMKGQVRGGCAGENADVAWLNPESSRWIRSELGLRDGPSLAAVKIKDDPRGLSESRASATRLRDGACAQVVSMGFWPLKDPEVAYISVLEDTKHDPRIRRGTLGKTIRIAKKTWALLEQETEPCFRMASHCNRKISLSSRKSGTMPDLRYMTMRHAVTMAMELGLAIDVKGTGVVIEQTPRPGAKVGKDTRCTLVCKCTNRYAFR